MTHRVLVLSGGPDHAHDFDATGRVLAELVRDAGHGTDLVNDPDEAARRLAPRPSAGEEPYAALVVNALRWQMRGDAYDPWRARWAYTTSVATRAAIAGFVERGGGLVGIHTASICFDDWPEWPRILGGAWSWGHSSHPPPGPVSVTVEATHPVIEGLDAGFDLVDEVYGDLDVHPNVTVLATARRTSDDHPQPVVWVHTYGRGRIVYDAFGHDTDSLTDECHERLIQQAVEWVCARSEPLEAP